MTSTMFDRRTLLGGMAGLAAFGTQPCLGCAPHPRCRPSPVALNVIDVAGQLQLTQGAMDGFAKANPKLVSKITFSQAPAPELPGKIKAQQARRPRRHRPGADRHRRPVRRHRPEACGSRSSPTTPSVLPKLADIYLPGALKMQGLAQDQAVCVVFCPAGPIIEYMPDAVKTPPKTAQELLDWTKAHPEAVHLCAPRQFRPRPHLPAGPALHPERQGSDGPEGRLGQDLGLSRRTGQEHRILPDRHRRGDEGTGRGLARHDRLASRLGPQSAHPRRGAEGGRRSARWKASTGSPTRSTWAIPKGVSNDKLAVLLDMTEYMLSKPAQAMTYDKGYFYPGPAVKDVPLSMAPKDSQDAVNSVQARRSSTS